MPKTLTIRNGIPKIQDPSDQSSTNIGHILADQLGIFVNRYENPAHYIVTVSVYPHPNKILEIAFPEKHPAYAFIRHQNKRAIKDGVKAAEQVFEATLKSLNKKQIVRFVIDLYEEGIMLGKYHYREHLRDIFKEDEHQENMWRSKKEMRDA